jgi:hypothetical protein
MLRIPSRTAACAAALALGGLAALAGQRSASLEAASDITAATPSLGVPWWKRSLAHTVQEEWLFAQHMDTQHGPRWRTALPDKTVARLYQAWLQDRNPGP